MTFEEIEAFRREPEALAFSNAWIREMRASLDDRNAPAGDHVINLSVWIPRHPHKALGLLLNLLDTEGINEDVQEMIAMGPATAIVEETGEDFTAYLQHAVSCYPRFALFTKWNREHSEEQTWMRLRNGKKAANSEGSAAPERAAGPRLNKPVSGED